MKIHPVGIKLFHADRQTDRQTNITKLIVAFTILRMHLKMKNLCLASTILKASSIIGWEKLITFQTPEIIHDEACPSRQKLINCSK
jgi:hypothetical protein